ncbi:MAG: ABC transporter ATP-binding protein [Proteobacteria bacterium]|nr:ABC transporter ATP-binding protein [Pseudomonadota bacterium]
MRSAHLLEIKDLSVSFRNVDADGNAYDQPVVQNLSLQIGRGELVALVGESGSGKTVTALSVLKLLPANARLVKGNTLFRGQDISLRSDVGLQAIRGKQISMVFQEPMSALNPLHTIEKQIHEAILLHQALWPDALKKRTSELLTMVGLEALESRLKAYPHELSGGQRQRICIAMALANKPDILIADEPTTALDVTVQAQILTLLKDLQKSLGMGVLLITHDLTLVRRMADRVAIMQKGVLVESGAVAEVFRKPKHPYTKHLLESAPHGKPVMMKGSSAPIAEVTHLTVRFPLAKNFFGMTTRHLDAVNDVTLTLKTGRTLGIVGESGSGKSTLAHAVLRLTESTGSIQFEGTDLRGVNGDALRTLRSRMQIVFQDPFASLNPRLTVRDTVAEGLRAHQADLTPESIEKTVIAALKEVGLDGGLKHRYPHEFSGGQRQRIAIARALVLNPSLLVLDEPTSALDLSTQSDILELLKALQKQRKLSYIFISHDLRVIRSIAHDIVVMKEGKIVESGTNSQIFSKPKTDYTKRLIESALIDAE